MFTTVSNFLSRTENQHIEGLAFVGDNSSGKTVTLRKLSEDLISHKKDVIYIPENRQDLLVKDYKGDQFSPIRELRALFEIIQERMEENQKEDIEKSLIPEILSKNFDLDLEFFFKEKINFELKFEDTIKIKINPEINFLDLTSSGYKSIIRITTEIFLYLEKIKNNEVYILLDEIDSKLDWKLKEIYVKELIDFLKNKFLEKKLIFIVSTHMPETINTLPDNFIIFKFYKENNNTKSKQFISNDFQTLEQIERIIFEKRGSYISESQNLKILKQIYFSILKKEIFLSSVRGSTMDFIQFNEHYFDYNKLSIKEKIIFNSILDLVGV